MGEHHRLGEAWLWVVVAAALQPCGVWAEQNPTEPRVGGFPEAPAFGPAFGFSWVWQGAFAAEL